MEQYFTEQTSDMKYFILEKDIIENSDGTKSTIIEVKSTLSVNELIKDYEYVRQIGATPVLKKKENK